VGVKQQRTLRAGRLYFGVNSRRCVWRWAFEQTRSQPALLHHFGDEFCVAADVLGVGGDVWNREQSQVFLEDLVFVGAPVIANFFLRRLLCGLR
jgi:hypothetical protein